MTLVDKSHSKTARTDTYYITVLKRYHLVIHMDDGDGKTKI